MAGNRTKLNKKTIGLIADAIGIGANKEIAAGYARITVSCLMHWLQMARAEEERREKGEIDPKYNLHIELLHAIDDAQADLAIECLSVVQKARARGETEWAWKLLVTKHREEFGDRQRQEITGKDGKDLIDTKQTDRAISTLADAIGKIISSQGGEQQSVVDSAECSPMVSSSDEGG